MSTRADQIAGNVERVRERIGEAAVRSGRDPKSVALLAVTKYVGEPEIRALVAAGCALLGESRPQQLWDRCKTLQDVPVHWHMIGPLQRNKVRRTLPLVKMVQSGSSVRLVEAIDCAAGELALRMPILLEVNVSGEAAKQGFSPAELEICLDDLAACANVEIRGLMCMAGLEGGLDEARREFAALRELRDRLQTRCPNGVGLAELSMGMSGDFEMAIEEGATIVRIGSLLFEGITP